MQLVVCGVRRASTIGEMERMHGMYGTQHAELEVQRTVKRAQLTSFLCFLRKAVGPSMTTEGSFDGLWRGEMI